MAPLPPIIYRLHMNSLPDREFSSSEYALLEEPLHKHRLAIVVVAYRNRSAVMRLLVSICNAVFSQERPPLLLSLSGDDAELEDFFAKITWEGGAKILLKRSFSVNPADHFLLSGNLVRYFKSVILLEEGLFVMPGFYQFTHSAIEQYEEDKRVGAIALYSFALNPDVGLPFIPLRSNADVYALQRMAPWGACISETMWSAFRKEMNDSQYIDSTLHLPDRFLKHNQPWHDRFSRFLVAQNQYVLYPYESYCANLRDGVTSPDDRFSFIQPASSIGNGEVRLRSFSELIRYDIFFNPLDRISIEGIDSKDICIDLYATKNRFKDYQFLLTPAVLSLPVVKCYGLLLRPHEANVIFDIGGDALHLYAITPDCKGTLKKGLPTSVYSYHINGFGTRFLMKVLLGKIRERFSARFGYSPLRRKFKSKFREWSYGRLVRLWNKKSRHSALQGMILMFHHVTNEYVDTLDSCICSIDTFRETIERLIRDGYRFISMDEAIHYMDRGSADKFVVVTFDDIPESVFLHAYPILQRMQIPFVVYLTCIFINRTGYISDSQIDILASDPLCTIGSHTISHPVLSESSTFREEIRESKRLLESRFQRVVNHFAYPYGRPDTFNKRIIREVKEAGYLSAVSAVEAPISDYTARKRFWLPRKVLT